MGIAFSAMAQNADVIAQVTETIKAGSAKELSKFLNPTVDVTIEGKVENYSKAQAEFVLRDFFKAHPPNEFMIIHQGQSKGGQPFAIGQYKSQGDTYRVWMKLKVSDNQQLIQEISFVRQ
jgi:putative sterol carrier protein